MNVETVPATYARALLELAQEKGVLEVVREETASLVGVLEREKDLRTFVESPRIPKAEKEAVLERSLRGKVSDQLLNFMLLVVKKGREVFLLDALREYGVLHDERVGLLRARVTTALPLAESEAETLRQRLAASLGKKIELEPHVDPSILGGFVIRFNGMVADASLQTELESIGDRMLSVKFGSELIHED